MIKTNPADSVLLITKSDTQINITGLIKKNLIVQVFKKPPVYFQRASISHTWALMAQSPAGTKRDNSTERGGGGVKKERASGMHQGVPRRSCLPGGSDNVMAPVTPFKIRIGSDPFPLHHSGSLSLFVCLLVSLKPFTGDARKETEVDVFCFFFLHAKVLASVRLNRL